VGLMVVAALLASCSALLDLSPLEFVDGRADGAALDGGDGSADDARKPDADPDAKADAPPSPTGCAFVDAEFCDDFDLGEPLSVRWTSKSIQGDASIDPSDAQARSAFVSLRGESVQPEAFLALLLKSLPTYADRFTLTFDVLFAVAPTGGTFLVQGGLTRTAGNNNDAIGPTIAAFPGASGGVEITAFNWTPFSGQKGVSLATVAVGKWTHVVASVRRDVEDGGATSTVGYVVDGVPFTRVVPWEAAAVLPGLFVGPQSGGAMVEVYFDNVTMDTR
jgi:hypothetical protein